MKKNNFFNSDKCLKYLKRENAYLEKLGLGSVELGLSYVIHAHKQFIKELTPNNFNEQEITLMGEAFNCGYQMHKVDEVNLNLSSSVEDFYKYKSNFAQDYDVNKDELLKKIKALDGAKTIALMEHIQEVVFVCSKNEKNIS